MIIFALRTVLCLLAAIQVWLGVTTGSAISWASAAFVSLIVLTGDWRPI